MKIGGRSTAANLKRVLERSLSLAMARPPIIWQCRLKSVRYLSFSGFWFQPSFSPVAHRLRRTTVAVTSGESFCGGDRVGITFSRDVRVQRG